MSQFSPNSEVSNLYVDLVSPTGNTIARKKMPVFAGTANGNIDLSMSAPQGVYLLKAYTKVDLIAKNISVKPIYLFNPSLANVVEDPAKNFYECIFFGLADSITAGMKNTLFFKANDMNHFPVTITGSIINPAGKHILEFKNEVNGTGKIQWVPVAGEVYLAQVNFPSGLVKRYVLPPVKSGGITLSIDPFKEYILVHLLAQGDSYENAKLSLSGRMDGRTAFIHPIGISNREYHGKIPVKELPDGILHISVLCDTMVLAKTKTLIKKSDSSAIRLMTGRNNNDSSFNLSLAFPDSMFGVFSLSVTDYDREIVSAHNNIYTDLLINQEDANSSILLEASSLSDKIITETAVNTITEPEAEDKSMGKNYESFSDSNYLTLNAQLIDSKTKKPLPGKEVTLFLYEKDSTLSIFNPVTSENGSLQIQNLVFYDTATFRYEWKNNRPAEFKIEPDLQVNSENIPFTPFISNPNIFYLPENIRKSQITYRLFTDTLSGKILSPVIVKSRLKTAKEQVDENYATGLFAGSTNARILDLIHEPPNYSMNIFEYLQGKFGDLIIKRINAMEYDLSSTRTLSMSGPVPIKLFLDQHETTSGFILAIPLNNVAIIKYYPPGNARLPGIGAAGVIAIYTKKNEDVQVEPGKYFLNSFKMSGYSPIKEFTTELHRNNKINNTTLYWEPKIIISPSENLYSHPIMTRNSTKRFHVVVEGFTSDGDILFLDTIIEK